MHRTIQLPIYPACVELITSRAELEYILDMAGMDCGVPDAPAACLDVHTDRGNFYILYFESHDIALDNVMLVHELIHLKNLVGEHSGIKMGLPAGQDEHEAYFFDALFSLFTDVIRHKDRPEVLEPLDE